MPRYKENGFHLVYAIQSSDQVFLHKDLGSVMRRDQLQDHKRFIPRILTMILGAVPSFEIQAGIFTSGI